MRSTGTLLHNQLSTSYIYEITTNSRMLSQVKKVLQNRQNAGRLLAEKLYSYKNSDAIVVAVPQGGVPVGREIAKALDVPFEIIFSKRIKDPSNSDVSIGAVSLDEVVLNETGKNIPQSYVSHQISILRQNLKAQFDSYYTTKQRSSLEKKTVILVDDVLRETGELMACIRSIQKQNPKKIVVAVAVAMSKAAHLLADDQFKFVYLFMEFTLHNKPYTYFPEVEVQEQGALTSSGNK